MIKIKKTENMAKHQTDAEVRSTRVKKWPELLFLPIHSVLMGYKFYREFQQRVDIHKRFSTLFVFVAVCFIGSLFLSGPYLSMDGSYSIQGEKLYFLMCVFLGIFTLVFCYCRQIFASFVFSLFLTFAALSGLIFLNGWLDHPEKKSYLVTHKYKDDEGCYVDCVDEKTEKTYYFSVSQDQYQSMNLEQKKYWVHTEEGRGFFHFRWHKDSYSIFNYSMDALESAESNVNESQKTGI